MLAIEVFQKLIIRVTQIHKVKPIREDDLCLILMHALNMFREIIETNKGKDKAILSEKEMLLK